MLPSLFRSPIGNLTKSTSVCKAWRSIVENPTVICPQFSRTVHATNLNDSPLFLVHRVSGQDSSTLLHKAIVDDVTNEVYSLHCDNQNFDQYSKVEFPISHMGRLSNSHLRVVGTCNGLVCLADDIFSYGYNFFLWNPAIRKLLKLPVPGVTYRKHGGYDATIGFGFDAVTNDYKVVRIVTLLDDDEKLTVAEVYSLATGSWTSLGSLAQCQLRGAASQAFVNGALHWPALRWGFDGAEYFILTFDVGSQLFGEISVPKSLTYNFDLGLRLSVYGDGNSIALFTTDNRYEDSFLGIWAMLEYGEKESWAKLITLGTQGPERLLPRALCFRKSMEVLLKLCGAREQFFFQDIFASDHVKSKHELVSLDLVTKQIKNLGISGDGYPYCTVDSYKESLALLDKTDAVSY